ncbi:hypothetical protein PG987_001590 [Apiospora arundinis]
MNTAPPDDETRQALPLVVRTHEPSPRAATPTPGLELEMILMAVEPAAHLGGSPRLPLCAVGLLV